MATKQPTAPQGEFQVREPEAAPQSSIVMEPEEPQPGTKAFIENDPVNKELLTEADKRAILRYSNEEIEARNAKLPAPSGVKVITDQWYGDIKKANPYDKAAAAFIADNPDKAFRWQDDAVRQRLGDDGYVNVVDPQTGKTVEAGGQKLTWMPGEVAAQLRQQEMELASAQISATSARKRAAAEAPEADGLRHIGGITARREGDARATVIEGHSGRPF